MVTHEAPGAELPPPPRSVHVVEASSSVAEGPVDDPSLDPADGPDCGGEPLDVPPSADGPPDELAPPSDEAPAPLSVPVESVPPHEAARSPIKPSTGMFGLMRFPSWSLAASMSSDA
jgi:hypothetical protein